MGRLDGKVAVVLPGTYGVGHDAAVLFAREGARVVVGGADEENGAKTLAAIERAGGAPGRFVRCDLLVEADIERVVRAAVEHEGGLDVAFGCPDYYVPGLVEHQGADVFDWTQRYNARSLLLLSKHAVPALVARAGGSLIFLSSVYALVTGSVSCAYEVSKGAVLALGRVLGERYAAQRVRVNCIAAGHVIEAERGLKDELPSYAVRDPKLVDLLEKFYPAGRLAVPEDVARAALFLASDDSSYMSGSTLTLEGGFLCR
jgi:NAD(P)-dependent dehydrogenase (short-subunit alcohol dehydrogenase family)